MQVPSPTTFAPDPATLAEAVASIPASRGIYALATTGAPPHIGWSINLKRRLTRLLVPSYTASHNVLSGFARKFESVRYWRVASRLETSVILYELTRNAYPDSYLRRLHLQMPWLIGLSNSGFARLEVTNRLGLRSPTRYGPFRTKEAAQIYEEQLLSLHQIRRCIEILHPSVDHPGCIYGEMNQCLRPCQTAVSPDEYRTEAERVYNFLASAGKSALLPLTAARDRAATELDFEQAALAHKRIERVQAAIATRDKIIGPAQNFHGVALIPSTEPDSVKLWPMYEGFWQTPIDFAVSEGERSLDSSLRECLGAAFSSPTQEGNRLEHLALFSRWYYSTWRDGHWFSFEDFKRFAYRRLVKAISEMLKPPTQKA